LNKVNLLWQLQDYDISLNRIEIDLKDESYKEKLENLNIKLNEYKYDLETARTKLEINKVKIARNNQKLEQMKFELDELNEKLYSGNTSNMNELIHLQEKEKELKSNFDKFELETIYLMEEVEKNNIEVYKFDDKYKTIKNKIMNYEKEIEENQNSLKEEKIELDNKRIKLIEEIDENILAQYKKIKNTKKIAIAKVENNVCSGCHMTIPLYILSELNNGDELIRCDNCGRIIFLD